MRQDAASPILSGAMGTSLRLAVLSACVWAAWGCAAPARRSYKSARREAYVNASPLAKAVVRTAKSYLPEEENGRPAPRDCSDFVQKVFAENGVKLPRTSSEMSLAGTRVASSKELRMGDLVLFSGEKVSRVVGHVGIYINNGVFINVLSQEGGVEIGTLYSDYFRKRYLTGRRVIP